MLPCVLLQHLQTPRPINHSCYPLSNTLFIRSVYHIIFHHTSIILSSHHHRVEGDLYQQSITKQSILQKLYKF